MTPAWTLLRNAPLRALNTFHVDATAPLLLRVDRAEALPQALALPELAARPLLPLGRGSNVLLAGDPEATVLVFGDDSMEVLEHRADHAIVRVGAGKPWHALVMESLAAGLSGLENMALIPGSVGAAPVQNIGAYGAQMGEFVHVVEAWDRGQARFVRLDREQCRFGYRDSLFKHEPGRYLVVAVEFNLPLLAPLRLDYAGIREELAAMGIAQPVAADVAEAVIRIRRRKLPDPDRLGNAGSFFKNPMVAVEQAEVLRQDWPTLPVYPGDDAQRRKLSAAWLIEQAGWKGFRDGDAGVSPDHALVLVNHGHATGAQLLTLARRIAASVRERFGIELEPEPLLVGARW